MKILLFAQLGQATGCSELEWPMNGPLAGTGLWQQLVAKYPGLGPFSGHVRLARNCEYVAWDERLADDDEVALIPPVSGG